MDIPLIISLCINVILAITAVTGIVITYNIATRQIKAQYIHSESLKELNSLREIIISFQLQVNMMVKENNLLELKLISVREYEQRTNHLFQELLRGRQAFGIYTFSQENQLADTIYNSLQRLIDEVIQRETGWFDRCTSLSNKISEDFIKYYHLERNKLEDAL